VGSSCIDSKVAVMGIASVADHRIAAAIARFQRTVIRAAVTEVAGNFCSLAPAGAADAVHSSDIDRRGVMSVVREDLASRAWRGTGTYASRRRVRRSTPDRSCVESSSKVSRCPHEFLRGRRSVRTRPTVERQSRNGCDWQNRVQGQASQIIMLEPNLDAARSIASSRHSAQWRPSPPFGIVGELVRGDAGGTRQFAQAHRVSGVLGEIRLDARGEFIGL